MWFFSGNLSPVAIEYNNSLPGLTFLPTDMPSMLSDKKNYHSIQLKWKGIYNQHQLNEWPLLTAFIRTKINMLGW